MMKVCLLGASGSIGKQTIDVMQKNKDRFELVSFSLGNRINCISSVLKKYPNIKHICVKNEKDAKKLALKYRDINFYFGDEGLLKLIENSSADMVVNALVGFVGLAPTLCSLKLDKILCLANKESLVVGGELVNDILKQGNGRLYPIDSEHVALAKCLSVQPNNVKKLIITASGGAFRKLSRKELRNVTPEDALKHPTWNMGNKITIDSASMVNKTFEIIEAYHLFGYGRKDIDVILNSNSFVHSIVEYKDGTYRLDAGKPDMRIPIKYALFEGVLDYKTVYCKDYRDVKGTEFGEFSIKRYPAVKHAKTVMDKKGTYGAVLNASNEVAVYAFLDHEIKFLSIEKIINLMMKKHENILHPTYEQLLEVDRKTRDEVRELIRKGGVK